MAFCESCKQPVQSNAPQKRLTTVPEAVDHGVLKMRRFYVR